MLISHCGSLYRDIKEVAGPCLWHLRRKHAYDVRRLTFDFAHTRSLSLLCLRRKLKTLQWFRHIILSSPYSVLLTEYIFSKAEIILSRKLILFNNPACWQMFKREKKSSIILGMFCEVSQGLFILPWERMVISL